MHRSTLLVPFLLLLPLHACSTPDINLVAQSCPATAVLAQASSVARFRGGGVEPANMILSAEMIRPILDCDYDFEGRRTDVDLRFTIALRTGPAGQGSQGLSYFVAVIGPAGNMISKRVFQRNVNLAVGPGVLLTEDVYGTTIGLAETRQPSEYQILIGFQLTPEELARNESGFVVRP